MQFHEQMKQKETLTCRQLVTVQALHKETNT